MFDVPGLLSLKTPSLISLEQLAEKHAGGGAFGRRGRRARAACQGCVLTLKRTRDGRDPVDSVDAVDSPVGIRLTADDC